jgi:hypothetical protein
VKVLIVTQESFGVSVALYYNYDSSERFGFEDMRAEIQCLNLHIEYGKIFLAT